MIWNVVSLFPDSVQALVNFGVIGSALERKIILLNVYNPRDYTVDKHKTVDDRPFGGGDGMVMQADILDQTLSDIKNKNPQTVFYYLSPQGEVLNESWVQKISSQKNVTLICGRYGGVDQRILNHWNIKEISIGDYVISGGELAAGVVIDACSRKYEGVLGHQESAALDSHANGEGLEAPLMTRPRIWRDQEVPEILLSGHHENIQKWREKVGYLVTLKKRPDLFRNLQLKIKISELQEFWKSLSSQDKKVLNIEEINWQDFI